MSETVTEAQKKAIGRWGLARYFGWAIGGGWTFCLVLITISGQWQFWTPWFALACLALVVLGTIAHWQLKKLPDWRPPRPTKAENLRWDLGQCADGLGIYTAVAIGGALLGFAGWSWGFLISAGALLASRFFWRLIKEGAEKLETLEDGNGG